MTRRHIIQWSATATDQLRALPKDAARGLYKQADRLAEVDDPRTCCKPLAGPLSGFFRIRHSRYRAIFDVTEETLASGDTLVRYKIRFIAAGKREERSKADVYRLAEKLVAMGVIKPQEREDE